MTKAELNSEIRQLSAEIEKTELQLRALPAVRFDLVKRHGELLSGLAAMGKDDQS